MDSKADVANSENPSLATAPAKSQPSSGGLAVARSLVLALVAGGIVTAIILAVFPVFKVPAELMIPFPPPEIAVAREARIDQCHMLNGVVALGALGFFMSVLIGGGEAAARGFSGGAVGGLVAGVVLATILGCLSAVLGHFLMQQLDPIESLVPIARTFLAQACTLGLLGAGVAAAVGLVTGGASSAASNVVSGVMAAIVVAFLFPLVSSFAIPNLNTEINIPGAGAVGVAKMNAAGLMLYLGMIVVALGLLIPLGNRSKRKKK